MELEELMRRNEDLKKRHEKTMGLLENGYAEALRVSGEVKRTRQTLDDLDEEFKYKTGLTDTDIILLFIAIGLQVMRQYLLSNDKLRLTSNQGDVLMQNALSLSPPSWQEVLLRSVPYDAIATGAHIENTGLSGTTHRFRTLGHDPLLGWIFGTANIMTNSLTKTNLETYQVNMSTMTIVRHYPMGVSGMLGNAVKYGLNDPKLLGASVARQAIHFGSDFFTKQSLPVPIIATLDDDLALKMMTKWHIDSFSISRNVGLSIFINNLIAVIHGLFYSGNTEQDQKLYDVRTRKILMYSDAVASSTNLMVVACTEDFSKLDVGGAAVTIYRLITDTKFIRKVKEDFIFGSYRDLIMGDGSYLYRP